MGVHPAYRAVHAQLGFLITSQNARFARPEDVARWGKAITEWSLAHPEAPQVPSLVISAVEPRSRATPESAAAQEALALADRAATEEDKLVVAILCGRPHKGDGPRFEIVPVFYPDFVHACDALGAAAALDGHRQLETATPAAFTPCLAEGWVPVAVAYGDESADATFLPVVAGLALVEVPYAVVTEEGMKAMAGVLEAM
jgi:hypothetical protein